MPWIVLKLDILLNNSFKYWNGLIIESLLIFLVIEILFNKSIGSYIARISKVTIDINIKTNIFTYFLSLTLKIMKEIRRIILSNLVKSDKQTLTKNKI